MPKSVLLPSVFAFLILSIFGVHYVKTLTTAWKPLIHQVMKSVNMNKSIYLLRNENQSYFNY